MTSEVSIIVRRTKTLIVRDPRLESSLLTGLNPLGLEAGIPSLLREGLERSLEEEALEETLLNS